MSKPHCKFGHNDTCDGINGTSGFICRECVEDAEWEAESLTHTCQEYRPDDSVTYSDGPCARCAAEKIIAGR